MGDPKKQKKRYSRPKKLFDLARISEEKGLLKRYGLKNRKEIWIAEAKTNKIRNQAKKLIIHPEEQKIFFEHLNSLGLVDKNATLDDVLALTKEKLLERRFQTIVLKKKLAKKIRGARQLIAHKKIKIGDQICDVPGRIITLEEENKINLKNG